MNALHLVFTCWIAQADTATATSRPATQSAPARTLVVATKHSPPFAFQDAAGTWTGISIELWRQLAKNLNLTYRIEERPLDRMLSDLAAGRIDAAVAAISVTPERERLVDFSHPYYTTGLGVAVLDPGERGLWGTLGRIFTAAFFKILGGLLLLTAVAGFLFWVFERRRNPAIFSGTARRGIREGIWWSIIVLLGHKGIMPASTSARVLAAGGMLASLLALSTLTGAIASVLTVGQLETTLQYPDDLRHVRLVTVRDSTSAAYLRKHRISFEAVSTVEVALDTLAGGGVDAVVYDEAMLKYLTNRGFGNALRVLPWSFHEQEYAVAVASKSPLREPLNQALLTYRADDAWKQTLYRYLGE